MSPSRGFKRIEDLDLDPSLYVPFQNAKLEDGKFLIVKNQTQVGSRMQEELKIETFIDPTLNIKLRPRSGPYFYC